VILSTHIVEDVSDLCPSMAVLAAGRILVEGAPADLVERLSGRVWRKIIDRAELDAHRARHDVIASRLAAGRLIIHVLADTCPDAEFEPVQGGLEDVYFSTLSASRRAA
jgi:ABC-type multidrug transport system ATPase subunit